MRLCKKEMLNRHHFALHSGSGPTLNHQNLNNNTDK